MNAALRVTVGRAAAGDRAAVVTLLWLLDREGGPQLREAVWRSLLAVPMPDRDLWQAVQGYCLAALTADELLAAAARDDGHPVAAPARQRILDHHPGRLEELCLRAPGRPGLAAWCAGHALASVDKPVAALLLLVSGQIEQYHAEDPDGSALRAALERPGLGDRRPVLAAMAAAGVEPALVVGGSPAAGSGRSGLLWSLPVAQAAEAARGLGGWRPESPTEARLVRHLAGADAGRLDRATFDLIRLAPPVAVAPLPDGRSRVVDLCELPERPLGELTPAELGVLERYLSTSRPPAAVRELLELLRDCLRLRYGDEIELGGLTT
ncbi:hypothetical protein [Dactylosporangium matsuzakiense]|uniref:Uncharacterized protein n=1 Tax=Dactylosporangium matsuzakiense TaxID=53360 RepID=A0A9W6KWM5_9ACTN|nr:hypothetical protein [Dactylosporangium matsuzakiense]UWZ47913.1 hypothetical protein Dmats_16845 [Dactylosporangium matsuzakiense]GLL08550.1 hypothetical protein GCM10017581_103170 [Dactylosporangium matsuzakiense]